MAEEPATKWLRRDSPDWQEHVVAYEFALDQLESEVEKAGIASLTTAWERFIAEFDRGAELVEED